MNKTFIQDFHIKDELWNMYSISYGESMNYFHPSNKNNINDNNIKLPNPITNFSNYIYLSNKIIYSILNDETPQFLNIYDNQFYDVFNIFLNYLDAPMIFFCCNKEDPFIVVQLSSYLDFHYIIYVNKKELLVICDSGHIGNIYMSLLIPSINKIIENLSYTETKFKKYLFFGFNHNIGHHVWNEISGLYYFLENKDYHNKIDGIIIGHCDSFDMEYYLKQKYNFDVITFNNFFNKNLYYNEGEYYNTFINFINLKDIFPVFLSSTYIDREIPKMIDFNINNYTNNKCEEIKFEENKNIIEISIDIRTNRRYLMNQDIFYTNLIKNLLKDYNNYFIKINFLGCFQTKNVRFDANNNEFIDQNIIVNKIIENFNETKNISFKNFIGEKFFLIKENVINSTIFIQCFGTCMSNLLCWIYRTNVIGYGPCEAYNWIAIEKELQNTYISFDTKEFVTLGTGLQENFDVDFERFYNFFKEKLNELI